MEPRTASVESLSETSPQPTAARWVSIAVLERLSLVAVGAWLVWLGGVTYAAGQVSTNRVALAAVLVTPIVGFVWLALGVAARDAGLAAAHRLTPLVVVGALVGAFWAQVAPGPRYGADTLALAHLAAEATLAGRNPYQLTIEPDLVEQRFGLPSTALTQLQGGGSIERLVSYPALHHLLLVPPLALGLQDLRWVVLGCQLASLALLWIATPGRFRLWGWLLVLINPDLALGYTLGGLTDWLWVLPLSATAVALQRRRLAVAAVALGLACAVKQHPWLVAPFLAIWTWHQAGGAAHPRGPLLLRLAALAGASFLVPNLPYAAWDPSAWLRGLLLPLTEPLVAHGAGLSLLTQVGLLPMVREFYALSGVAVAVLALALYHLFFREVRPAVWLCPPIVLWFSYRPLPNYFVAWLPLFVLGIGLELQRRARPAALDEVKLPATLPPWWRHRRALALGSAGLTVCLLGVAGLATASDAGFDLRVRSMSAESLDRIAVIEAEVTNRRVTAMDAPAFFVLWESYPFAWHRLGPEQIPPGQTATFQLRPPSLEAAPVGDPVGGSRRRFPALLVRATARDGRSAVARIPQQALPTLPIVNGTFSVWAPAFGATPRPYGWEVVEKRDAGADVRLERRGQSGVSLRIHGAGQAEDWSEIGLYQAVDLRSCDVLRLFSSRSFDFAADEAGWPVAIAGVEVRAQDATELFAWLPLTEGAWPGYVLPSGQLVVPIAAPRSAARVDIALGERLGALGRSLPAAGVIKVFAAVRGGRGEFRFTVDEAACLPSVRA